MYQIGDRVLRTFLCTSIKHIPSAGFYVGTLHHNDTGDLSFKVNDIDPAWAGSVVDAVGYITAYNGQPQFNGEIYLHEDTLEPDELAKVVPSFRPAGGPKALLDEMCETFSVKGDPVAMVVQSIMGKYRNKFATWPGAKACHHARVGGLVEHTWNMYKAANAICDVYPVLDKILLLGGVLLHDVGKVQEYDLGNARLVNDYSTIGTLLGHTNLGVTDILTYARALGVGNDPRVIALANMVAAHHGQREYGATADAATPEAMVLHMLDNMDAKMDIYSHVIGDTQPGTVSDYVPTLGTRVFNFDRSKVPCVDACEDEDEDNDDGDD